MKEAFGNIKKETGVTIHGILGSDFFTRYKYVLDFDKLIFYKKSNDIFSKLSTIFV